MQGPGQGVNPSDVPHIFDRLGRHRANKEQTSGYGLGLSLPNKLLKPIKAQSRFGPLPVKGRHFRCFCHYLQPQKDTIELRKLSLL